jgi:hypothetical protein
MKCGKTGRPSNPRCFDPIKPGCACKEDLLLTQEGTCVEKDECDEIEPPIMDGNRPRPCDGIEMCCPESHDCMQPKGAGINMCVGKGDSIVNPKPCNIIADGKPPIADGTMPRPEPCDGIEMCCPESHKCTEPRKGGGAKQCVGEGNSIIGAKPCPIACDGREWCCPDDRKCAVPRGGGVKQCVGPDYSVIAPKPCEEPPIADGTMPRPEPCDCSSKETGCTANGSPLKQCGCYYQEGGREDYICYTVGTCKAEGAQTSNVVKGATWRLCDKNNPNNFD